MNDFTAARADALSRAKDNLVRFTSAVQQDVKHWHLSAREAKILDQISRSRSYGRSLLSNGRVRLAAQAALIHGALDAYELDPTTRRYFVTITIDEWVTWERMPKIDPGALIDKAQRHLRRAGLIGVGAVETDIWSNLTGEPGRRLVPHVHFLARAVPRSFKPASVEQRMQASKALLNSVGGPSVTIRSIVQRPADIARVAQYMLKSPTVAKNFVASADGWRLYKREFPSGSAARLLEVFSHLEIKDVLFAIGEEGRSIAGAVRAAARQVGINAKTDAPTRTEIARAWADIRSVNGRQNFAPCAITPR